MKIYIYTIEELCKCVWMGEFQPEMKVEEHYVQMQAVYYKYIMENMLNLPISKAIKTLFSWWF